MPSGTQLGAKLPEPSLFQWTAGSPTASACAGRHPTENRSLYNSTTLAVSRRAGRNSSGDQFPPGPAWNPSSAAGEGGDEVPANEVFFLNFGEIFLISSGTAIECSKFLRPKRDPLKRNQFGGGIGEAV